MTMIIIVIGEQGINAADFYSQSAFLLDIHHIHYLRDYFITFNHHNNHLYCSNEHPIFSKSFS